MPTIGIRDFNIYGAAKIVAVVIVIMVFFNPSPDLHREGETEFTDFVCEVRRNIAEVMSVAMIYGDGIRVMLISRFGLEVAEKVTDVLLYAFAEVDASDSEVPYRVIN